MDTRAAMDQKLLLRHKSHKVSAEEDEEEEDRISNLPDTIVHRIFDCLPLANAAETSVLSKRWKCLWYSYPRLDFTSVFNNRYRFNRTEPTIDHVVSLLEKHSEDVETLRFLSIAELFPSGLKRLMRKAVRHNVQTLDVKFRSEKSFTLPRCIVNSLSLRDLRLVARFRGPGIALPPLEVMKSGFKSLGSLSLSRANLGGESNLFTGSSFPSLTNLRLESCLGLKSLRIQMPGLREFALEDCDELEELDVSAEKLEKLSVVSSFTRDSSTRVKIDSPMLEHIVWSRNAAIEECDIGTFDSLKEAVLGLSLDRDDISSDRKMRSASNILTGISRCERLTVEQELVKILSRFELCAFERLKSLKVQTCLSTGDARGLASLFRSSPFVNTVFISIEKDHHGYHEWKNGYWESQAQSLDAFLGRLRFVKVSGFGDETEDGGFVKFVLKHVEDLRRLSVSKVGRSIMADIAKSQLIFE